MEQSRKCKGVVRMAHWEQGEGGQGGAETQSSAGSVRGI